MDLLRWQRGAANYYRQGDQPMNIRSLICLPWCFSAFAMAQQAEQSQPQVAQDEPDEIVVIGERLTMQLRIQLRESEKLAYDIFNQFNDEERFDISCSVQERTGSRFAEQGCQPEFVIQASREHAQDYYNTMPGPGRPPDGSITREYAPMAMEIKRQQTAFQQKMKQVAEQHPEFLEAIARYAELQQQIREQTGQTNE
jgi:hypothetical protein